MSAARRVLALARALAWWRVRRNTLAWLGSSLLVAGFARELTTSHELGIRLLLDVAGLTPVLWLVAVVVANGALGAPPEHLPHTPRERTLAVAVAELGALLGSLAVMALVRTAWFGFLTALPARFPDPEAPSVLAQGADGLREAWIGAPYVAIALIVAGAVPVLVGFPVRSERWERALSGWALLVATAWLGSGSPVVGVVASASWPALVRVLGPAAYGDVEPRWTVAAVASPEQDEVVPVDEGVVPLLGRAALGRRARTWGWAVLATVVGVELVIAVGRLVATDPAAWALVGMSLRVFAAAALLVVSTSGEACWHPTSNAGGLGARGDDLLRYQRHLPIAPTALVDAPWRAFARQVGVVVPLALLWLRATGPLPLSAAVTLGALGAGLAAILPILRWIRRARRARTSTGAGSVRDVVVALVALELASSVLLVPGILLATRVGPHRVAGFLAFGALALATVAWAWARHRWST